MGILRRKFLLAVRNLNRNLTTTLLIRVNARAVSCFIVWRLKMGDEAVDCEWEGTRSRHAFSLREQNGAVFYYD